MTSPEKLNIFKELQEELEARKRKKKLFAEEYLTIDLDAANGWLYTDWIGYQTEGSVKEGCSRMLELLKDLKLTKVLNDNTNVLGIWTPAAHWVGAVWFPQMKEAGLKHFAWVYSPAHLSQFSTNESIRETPVPDIIQTFHAIEDAKKWLREQP
jgi:hypothetical protein